ncbi:hypothetical protein ACLB2K_050639 [Fragaria x ananassa]
MVGTMRVNLPSVETVMVASTKGDEDNKEDEHEPQLPLEGSQSSTMPSQQTTSQASQELDPKKLAEEISKALDSSTGGPARLRGSKTREYPVYGDHSYA